MLGFGIAKGFRYFVKCQRKSLLEPPFDLSDENSNDQTNQENNESENKNNEKHPKYSKAQARQRFKKGKT